MKRPVIRFFTPVVVTAAIATVVWVNAGQLEPPAGAINPTGPTTINGQDVNNALPYTISSPGSYILTSNIEAPGGYTGDGIVIDADNVTLDLDGFALIGVTGSLDGINVPSPHKNIAIHNGTIRDWGGDGVDGLLASNSQLGALRASDNGVGGFRVGKGSTVTNCTVQGNGGDGIFAEGSSTITGCTAFTNIGLGIRVGFGSTITGCTAHDNFADGIVGWDGSTITGCTAAFNDGDGIQVNFDCYVVGNNCRSNGNFGSDGAGIHVASIDNRIEANNVSFNDRGIDVDDDGNLIIRNSASSNTTNYDIVANNKVGVIVAAPNSGAISGDTGGAGVGSTDPWANFSF